MLPRYLLQTLNFLFNFHPSSDYLLRQTLPEETPMQEQKSYSLPIENDPVVVVVTQTIDSPVQHTTDGKKIIYLFYPFATNMN